jgi:hypothetical protein
VKEYRAFDFGLFAWNCQVGGEAISEAVADRAKRIVRYLHEFDDHGQEGAQHRLRLCILPLSDQGGHALEERVQLARDPKRLVLRKPTARVKV